MVERNLLGGRVVSNQMPNQSHAERYHSTEWRDSNAWRARREIFMHEYRRFERCRHTAERERQEPLLAERILACDMRQAFPCDGIRIPSGRRREHDKIFEGLRDHAEVERPSTVRC